MTRSANDAAVVIAEAIAGSEPDFAARMTRKAQTIGMANTVYVNASGLPADAQITTPRRRVTAWSPRCAATAGTWSASCSAKDQMARGMRACVS